MPRAPVITRTLTLTDVTCLCLETKTGETYEKVFQMLGKFRDDRAILKAIKKTYDSEDMVVILMLRKETGRFQCMMTEEKFVQEAQKSKIE